LEQRRKAKSGKNSISYHQEFIKQENKLKSGAFGLQKKINELVDVKALGMMKSAE
jgi:hypothetical protein